MHSDTMDVDRDRDPDARDRGVPAIIVEVCGRRCAIPADRVVELHSAVSPDPLPGAPEVITGMVNRRGTPTPVLDLRRRFDLPARPLQITDCLVVVEAGGTTVAVQVDAVLDLVAVVLQPFDAATTGVADGNGVNGVAVLPDGLAVIADVEEFLSSHERLDLDGALARAAQQAAP